MAKNVTPRKRLRAGDVVQPTREARNEIPWATGFRKATIVAVRNHEVEGVRESSLVIVTYETKHGKQREQMHETWLERV